MKQKNQRSTDYGRLSRRLGAPLFALALLFLSGCKLQYLSEDFSMVIKDGQAATLAITFQDFGSLDETAGSRNRDLEQLKRYSRDEEYMKEAADKGVTVTRRQLEFINYSVNGIVEATTKDYHHFFDVLPLYTWDEDEKYYYLTPQQTVLRAELTDGGRIVKRNGTISFRWPRSTRDIGFRAEYQVLGASFRTEFQREYSPNK